MSAIGCRLGGRTFGGNGRDGLDGGSRIIQSLFWAAVNPLYEGRQSHTRYVLTSVPLRGQIL